MANKNKFTTSFLVQDKSTDNLEIARAIQNNISANFRRNAVHRARAMANRKPRGVPSRKQRALYATVVRITTEEMSERLSTDADFLNTALSLLTSRSLYIKARRHFDKDTRKGRSVHYGRETMAGIEQRASEYNRKLKRVSEVGNQHSIFTEETNFTEETKAYARRLVQHNALVAEMYTDSEYANVRPDENTIKLSVIESALKETARLIDESIASEQ